MLQCWGRQRGKSHILPLPNIPVISQRSTAPLLGVRLTHMQASRRTLDMMDRRSTPPSAGSPGGHTIWSGYGGSGKSVEPHSYAAKVTDAIWGPWGRERHGNVIRQKKTGSQCQEVKGFDERRQTGMHACLCVNACVGSCAIT